MPSRCSGSIPATFAVHRQRHAVADVVQATLAQFSTRLDGHVVLNQVPPTLLVDADRDLLALALRQLLDNAVKYSAPGSTIQVSASSNGSVEIAIGNSGQPIPVNEQERIFERFFRGTHAGQVAGTGMGLAIVQQIAQAHGGTLSVMSSGTFGTQFTLSLPQGRSGEVSAGRILVVDDDPQIRRVMKVTLTGQGYEVDDAKNGEEALEKLREHRFDLVLLDMNMPGMGGLETCRTDSEPVRHRASSCSPCATTRPTRSGRSTPVPMTM